MRIGISQKNKMENDRKGEGEKWKASIHIEHRSVLVQIARIILSNGVAFCADIFDMIFRNDTIMLKKYTYENGICVRLDQVLFCFIGCRSEEDL